MRVKAIESASILSSAAVGSVAHELLRDCKSTDDDLYCEPRLFRDIQSFGTRVRLGTTWDNALTSTLLMGVRPFATLEKIPKSGSDRTLEGARPLMQRKRLHQRTLIATVRIHGTRKHYAMAFW